MFATVTDAGCKGDSSSNQKVNTGVSGFGAGPRRGEGQTEDWDQLGKKNKKTDLLVTREFVWKIAGVPAQGTMTSQTPKTWKNKTIFSS